MINFLDETIDAIKSTNHDLKDVMFVGSADGKYRMSIEKFVKKANFNYDDGYGGTEIATDLIVYFNDHTYMQRWEYDGSEGWEYRVKAIFNKTDEYKDFDVLGGGNYSDRPVEAMNNREKYDEEGYLIEED